MAPGLMHAYHKTYKTILQEVDDANDTCKEVNVETINAGSSRYILKSHHRYSELLNFGKKFLGKNFGKNQKQKTKRKRGTPPWVKRFLQDNNPLKYNF